MLIIVFPLSGSSLTYYPDRASFALKSGDLFIDTDSMEFHFSRSGLEAGVLEDKLYERLYSPFLLDTELKGVSFTSGKREYFLLYDPSLSQGFSYDGEHLDAGFLLDRGGSWDESLLLANFQRSGPEGIRGSIDYERAFLSVGMSFGFFPQLGAKCVLRGGVSINGASLFYARGDMPIEGRKLAEYLKLEYRSQHLDMHYSIGLGIPPVKVGTWRERYSREKLRLKLGPIRFTVDQSGHYSSSGSLSTTSSLSLSYRVFDLSLKNMDTLYFAYRSRSVSLRIGTDRSWKMSLFFERGGMRLALSFSSKQEVSTYVTCFF